MMPQNREFTPYQSAARTAPDSPVVYQNAYLSGLVVYIDVTAVSGSPSLVFYIEEISPNGDAFILLQSAAITGTGLYRLVVHPAAPVTANVSANTVLGARWRIRVTHGTADSVTYSVTVGGIPQ